MSMEEEWLKAYNNNASKDLPEYKMSYWSEEGFNELLSATKTIMKNIKDVKTVLDVGCGPGNYCELFAKKGFIVTGMDYSSVMISYARGKLKNKARFIVADCYNIPFKKESFDLVVSIGVLQCISDYQKAIEELKRTTKKYIILSTLIRNREVSDINQYLKNKLSKDSWPTMDYHPSELLPLFDGFETEVITHHKGSIITDGFFIVAKRK